MEYEIQKYINGDIEIDVNVSHFENTVWLSKDQMAILFNRDRTVISRHIKNCEINGKSMRAKNARMVPKNNRKYELELYNLDVISFVGERTRSKELTPFLLWAKEILGNNENPQKEPNIIVFNDKNLSLDVKIMPEENTVYLTKDQMSLLF